MKKKNVNKKKPWKQMAIIKVALNPEQAVLSCCDGLGRLEWFGGKQCMTGMCAMTGGDDLASS